MLPSEQNKSEAPGEDEIRAYRLIKWKTLRSVSVEAFREFLEREEYEKTFDNEYIVAVAERWRELQRTLYRFSALLFFLILFMGAINTEEIPSISLLGMKITGDSLAVSILLLLTSIIMFFVTAVSFTTSSYENVIKSYTEVCQPTEMTKFRLLRYGWSAALLFGEAKKYSYPFPANIAIFMSAILIIASIIVAATLVNILQYYFFISSIISALESEQLPSLINVPIVVVAICAVLFSACSMIVRIPLPYWDYSNLHRLTELEKSEPELANEIRVRIARDDLEKERKNIMVLQLTVVMSIAILPQIVLFGDGFFSEYERLVPLLTIPVVVLAGLGPMLDVYQRHSFRVHCAKGNTPVDEYVKWKRRMLRTRFVVCVIVGVLLFVAAERAIESFDMLEESVDEIHDVVGGRE